MNGGSGDADLYVRFDSEPTVATYDCRSYDIGNNENCDGLTVNAGTYHVMIRGYDPYAGVNLLASYIPADGVVEETFFQNRLYLFSVNRP